MHGERDGRALSSPPRSMLTDETTKNDINAAASSSSHNPPTELAYLPIGCSVSAKYRGAFCSAQVKAIEKLVKLKVTLLDSGDTITISEEQIVHPIPLRIGTTVTVRLASSNRRQSNDSNPQHHYSCDGLAAFINPTNPDEKQATIKQIIDNSIYTVVFNDGDEKSLRRSSLCLQGVRLYQTQYGQPKILEEMPTPTPTASTSPPPPSVTPSADTANSNMNDSSSIVAIKRQGSSNPAVFPALVLKRKALADYMWVRSFVDGREYIVHTRDDVQLYHDNQEIQALCRSTSKQATQACEKYIKYNQVPAVWQKKKRKQQKSDNKNTQSDDESSSESESSSSESDDDIDEETAEEKDSFVAQLFAFMDDRGTPINNIPKVQNYDLDLHRLFKLVRMFGGYNKVTKNDQWETVHIKMGLPDEVSSKNGKSIEQAYRNYLFAYEDLSKKLGSMNAPSAYFGGRTSMSSDSRRSLIRVRQQQHEEEKSQKKTPKTKQSPASVKQRSHKSNESRASVDSRVTSSTKKPASKSSTPVNRKVVTKSKPSNVLSSSSSDSKSESESDTSDDESSRSSSSTYNKTKTKPPPPPSTPPKKSTVSSSAIPKKIPPPSASSSATSTKTDLKKISTKTKPISSAANDSKQSKLTITIPIAKPKAQSSSSSAVQPAKKTSVPTSGKDEKKKIPEAKSVSIKTEPKPISSPITKKPPVPPIKSSLLTKTPQQQKPASGESSKPSTPSSKTPSSLLPFKPKTTPSQTSSNSSNNNNKDRSGLSKPASSSSSSSSVIDARQVKPNKINSSSTKMTSQERSASTPVKKTKPTISEEMTTKPLSAAPTMKIPKISANNDIAKKSPAQMDKIPKKQALKDVPVKIPKTQDSSSSHKVSTDLQTKPSSSSPTRPATFELTKKTIPRDISPLPVIPASPATPPPPGSATTEEASAPTALPLPLNNAPSLSYPSETTPEAKLPDTPLIFQPASISIKEANESETPSSTSNKRLHSDENYESVDITPTGPEIEEQLSPSKRARRSISSQESIETFSSSEQPPATENVPTDRNIQLTYEDISVNDILLVTWGNHGTKQYPARCLEKNDDKRELLVHYTGWNSRHDEWIKLDRVIEPKDSTNASTFFQQRPRRTSQINTLRQQHLDSTNSSSNLSEHNNAQQVANPLLTDLASSSTLPDDDESHKILKSISVERNNKTDESDIDDSSKGQSEMWSHVEIISSTEDDALSYSSTIPTNQSDTNRAATDDTTSIRRSISLPNNENILSTPGDFESVDENGTESESVRDDDHIHQTITKRRQSRATSSNNRNDASANIKTEQLEETFLPISDPLEHPHQYSLHVKEETIDSSSAVHQTFPAALLPTSTALLVEPFTPSSNILTSPPVSATGNRRASTRQQKRRSLREPNNVKDPSGSLKKRTKFDNGSLANTDLGGESHANMDQMSTRSNSTDQQLSENTNAKRYRPTGRRGGKKFANQPEYENEDYRSSSPSNITMRQQLKEMFKHRPSRYNFLDLNNNLTGDERITHLKDRMRDCQKVFFNLKGSLVRIEKQRKIFLRKQKPIVSATSATILQATPAEILGAPTCT